MPTDTRSRHASVTVALARASNLAMLPETAMRVIRLASNPNVTMSQLAEVIETSPELCARILRVVNSAFYGFPGQIRSIERATTLMGLQSVRNVTIAASLTRVFQGRALSPRFSPKDLWTHSVSVASATRLLAAFGLPALAEEAFLAGILHDIGLMMELQMDRVKFGALVAAIDSGEAADLLAAEEATFGATHQDFGGALLSAWQVPLTLSMAAQHHHDPYQLPIAHRTIPLMVHVAERLVAASDRPFLLEDPAGEIDDESLATLRIAHDQLDGILALLPDTITEIKLIFGGH